MNGSHSVEHLLQHGMAVEKGGFEAFLCHPLIHMFAWNGGERERERERMRMKYNNSKENYGYRALMYFRVCIEGLLYCRLCEVQRES